MIEHLIFFFYKLRYIPVLILIVLSVFFLGLMVSTAPKNVHKTGASTAGILDGPNAVTASMAMMANYTGRAISTTAGKSMRGIKTAATVSANTTKTVGRGTKIGIFVVAHTVGKVLTVTANAVLGGVKFTLLLPIKVIGLFTSAPAVSAIIKPAEHNDVPIIDPDSPELRAAVKALPPAQIVSEAPTPLEQLTAWPLSGQVTTQFGELGPLYRPAHTGIDITDNQRSGISPVKTFRQGKVVEISKSGGLGNHVVVDHGNGVTSVYGHLASISVVLGQNVDTSTTLGFEGTSGVSTGVHLHFEIRVNGQASDPHLFINGQP